MAFIEFVRVRDKDTGHEYDVVATAVDPKAHEVLKDYPENLTGLPRPAKHRTTTKATAPAAKPKEK
jgi:hypothetical protein